MQKLLILLTLNHTTASENQKDVLIQTLHATCRFSPRKPTTMKPINKVCKIEQSMINTVTLNLQLKSNQRFVSLLFKQPTILTYT